MYVKQDVEVLKREDGSYLVEEYDGDTKTVYSADVMIKNGKYIIKGKGARKYRQDIIEAIELFNNQEQ